MARCDAKIDFSDPVFWVEVGALAFFYTYIIDNINLPEQ